MERYVTLLHQSGYREIDRVELLEKLYHFVCFNPWSYVWLGEKPDLDTYEYVDAIHWLVMNLERTAGIQLYSDGMIRLNFSYEYIHQLDGEEVSIPIEQIPRKRCCFLTNAHIRNDTKNRALYDELLKILQEESQMEHEGKMQHFHYDEESYIMDPSAIEKLSEQRLYQYINDTAEGILLMEGSNRFLETEKAEMLSKLRCCLDYSALCTAHFGVEIEKPQEGERVKATPSFLAWYLWWSNYFDTISDEMFSTYVSMYLNDGDLSAFRPAGDWREKINE